MPGLIDILRRRLLVRRVIILAAHAALYALAFWGAFLLRFDFGIPQSQQLNFWGGLGLAVGFRLLAGEPFRIYGGVMHYASIETA
jgi:hypothetical protein